MHIIPSPWQILNKNIYKCSYQQTLVEISCNINGDSPMIKNKIFPFEVTTIWELLQVSLNSTK